MFLGVFFNGKSLNLDHEHPPLLAACCPGATAWTRRTRKENPWPGPTSAKVPWVPWVTQLRVAGGANGTMVSHENLWETIAAWWFGTMEFMTFHILGISSSHLTHIFQYGLKPPTSIGYIGDPQLYMIYYILNNLGGMHMQAARNELQMIDVPYTLWLFNIAMQNGPIYRWFTYLKKWFSIVILVYQRVIAMLVFWFFWRVKRKDRDWTRYRIEQQTWW